MFSRSYLALLAIGKTGGKQRTSETSKKKTMCTFTPTGTSSGCYICCCSYNSGGEFGCIWGSRRLRRYQNLRAAPARKLHRLAENKGVRGGQDVKGSQSIKHKQPTANKKKKKSTRSEAPRGWATGSARTIQQEDNKAAAAAKETEKLKNQTIQKVHQCDGTIFPLRFNFHLLHLHGDCTNASTPPAVFTAICWH